MSDLINMLRALKADTEVVESDDSDAVEYTWAMVDELAQKYVDFAQRLNQWCGTDDVAAVLPFEPPWYPDLLALVHPGGEIAGIAEVDDA